MRYINVIMGGMVAGIGGAYFTIGSVGRFDELLTSGKGFIGLAAMIFGKWMPFGAFGASLILVLPTRFRSSCKVWVSNKCLSPANFAMAPYLVTVIVLAGVIGQSIATDGVPYEKDWRLRLPFLA
jgi:simple sugar transport system permease protein